jgi:hypothetical protein
MLLVTQETAKATRKSMIYCRQDGLSSNFRNIFGYV